MIDVGDIAAWFDALYDTQTALKAEIPGGLWHDIVPEFEAQPYGSYVVTRTSKQGYSAGGIYTFTIDLGIFADKNTDADTQAIRRGVNSMMLAKPSVTSVRSGYGAVLSIWPSNEKQATELPMRAANDVVVLRSQWMVKVVGP